MTWGYLLSVIVCSVALFWLMQRADRRAEGRRAERLGKREPIAWECWCSALPGLSESEIRRTLPLIAEVIGVPVDRLHPDDSFDGDLALADHFACLVIDDDTTEQIRDIVEDRCGVRPGGDWQSLSDVVSEVGTLAMPVLHDA